MGAVGRVFIQQVEKKQNEAEIFICVRDGDRIVSCTDYWIRYDSTDRGVQLKEIYEWQNGGGMASQGGSDWKQGGDPHSAIDELLNLLITMARIGTVEVGLRTTHAEGH